MNRNFFENQIPLLHERQALLLEEKEAETQIAVAASLLGAVIFFGTILNYFPNEGYYSPVYKFGLLAGTALFDFACNIICVDSIIKAVHIDQKLSKVDSTLKRLTSHPPIT